MRISFCIDISVSFSTVSKLRQVMKRADYRFAAVIIFLLTFCGKAKVSSTFPLPDYPKDNAPTSERIELGKMLYFDPRLSGSNWISCASCHNPSLGWSDGLKTAIGHGFGVLSRNSPTIVNSAYSPLQFWDGRAESLEEQALGPIQSPGEMNQNLDELVTELKAVRGYAELFEKAYPGQGISKDTIAKAIANFERTVISKDSPFDEWMAGTQNAVSESAKKGYEIFNGKAKCVFCHSGFNFTDNGFHNIGVKGLDGKEDEGRFAKVPVKLMKGAFKTPTLRDVALTGPYMHNGIYKTLEEVIEHYDRGGDVKENLSPTLPKELKLSSEEKKNLADFLRSLTGKPVKIELPVLPQ